jgi:hypothetical protein
VNRPRSIEGRSTDINDTLAIQDYSDSLLRDLSWRVEKSQTLEQMVARESELDEVWRLLDFAVTESRRLGDAAETARLERLRAGVMAAHDLVGVDNDRVKAAACLRSLVSNHEEIR